MILNFHQKNLQDFLLMDGFHQSWRCVRPWPMSQAASPMAASKQPFTPATHEAEGVVRRASANHAASSCSPSRFANFPEVSHGTCKQGTHHRTPLPPAPSQFIARDVHHHRTGHAPCNSQRNHLTSLDETTMRHSTLKPPSSNDNNCNKPTPLDPRNKTLSGLFANFTSRPGSHQFVALVVATHVAPQDLHVVFGFDPVKNGPSHVCRKKLVTMFKE